MPSALAKMAIPTIVSQLITLIYNIADTWFIGKTNNPYMIKKKDIMLILAIITTIFSDVETTFAITSSIVPILQILISLSGRGRPVLPFL